MTLREFENRYWYATELRAHAVSIGIPAATCLRKDELQKAVSAFRRAGKAALHNRQTKDFIVEQARRLAPDVRAKSGVWYRLNRWREEQITSGGRPTYGDLVRRFVALNRTPRFEWIAYDCYVNFLAEFHAANATASRADALAAWKQLKKLDVPKNYRSWVKAR